MEKTNGISDQPEILRSWKSSKEFFSWVYLYIFFCCKEIVIVSYDSCSFHSFLKHIPCLPIDCFNSGSRRLRNWAAFSLFNEKLENPGKPRYFPNVDQ